MRTLAVIPARGGSKGIPRKNLRLLRGKPLIGWVIEAASRAASVDQVLVSTDSEEIANVAARFGAKTMRRDPSLAADHVTLDPVVCDAVARFEREHGAVDTVLTIQPTSPLLTTHTIDAVARRLEDDPGIDTVLTAVDDTHLAWKKDGDRPVPDYAARVNRQSLPPRYRETGGVLATRRAHVTPSGRIGPRVALHVLSQLEGLDIDSADDWLIAEAALGRRRIAFVVIGTREKGLGHVTRVMTLMESLTGHITRAFCTPDQDLALERLSAAFFPVEVVPKGGVLEAIQAFGADTVVHDELDTRDEDVLAERDAGLRVVCFEDRGAGLRYAHLVVNELYPEAESDAARGRHCGPAVYVLRDEFLRSVRRAPRERVERLLVTFGGTDPSRLTFKVLDAVAHRAGDIQIDVVAGRGFGEYRKLEERVAELSARGARVRSLQDVPLMSDVMAEADLAFSSAGRTAYELTHMRVPTIVLAQNDVEMQHTFVSVENGFVHLGLGAEARPEAIRSAFELLVESRPTRDALRRRMASVDLTKGRAKVVRLILDSEP